jgi:hypothetical protein
MLSQRIPLGIPITINLKTKLFVVGCGEFLVKKFVAKGLSEWKIELDAVIECEQDEEISTSLENFLGMATAPMASTPKICSIPRHQSSYLTKLVVIK